MRNVEYYNPERLIYIKLMAFSYKQIIISHFPFLFSHIKQ